MKYYIKIAGLENFNIYPIKIDIEKLFNAKLDFSSWTYDIGGFEFTIPKYFRDSSGNKINLIPDFYQIDDVVTLTSNDYNIDRNDTRIFVTDNSNIVVGDYYWLATERIKVVGKGSLTLNQYIDVERGKYLTIPQNYYSTTGAEMYNSNAITKYPKTLVGQLVYLYQYGNSGSGLIKIGIINDELDYSSGIFDVKCGDLIETLDIAIPELNNVGGAKYKSDTLPFSYCLYPLLAGNFLKWSGYLPALFNFLSIPEFIDYSSTSNFEKGVFSTFKDFIDFQCKLHFVFLVFNPQLQKYEFKQINFLSDQFEIESIKLKDYVNKATKPQIQTFKGISKAIIETKSLKLEFRNPLSLSLGLNKEFNLKIPDGVFIQNRFNPNSHIQILFSLFAIIYGKIKITSHIFLTNNLTVGNIYRITDIIDNLDTLQNVSDLCYCISKDNDDIEFIIIKNQIENPIAPSLTVEVTDYNPTTRLVTLEVTQVIGTEILNHIPEELDPDNFVFADFNQPESRYKYYNDNYFVILREMNTSVYSYGIVTSLSGVNMSITLNSGSAAPVVGDPYILGYGCYNNDMPEEQKDWIYFDTSVF